MRSPIRIVRCPGAKPSGWRSKLRKGCASCGLRSDPAAGQAVEWMQPPDMVRGKCPARTVADVIFDRCGSIIRSRQCRDA